MMAGGGRRGEAGGLLIVLMVGVAVMFIGVAVAVQAWSVTWRRDSEDELIFRGNQYVDAILAYRKDHNGQFPVNLDDLMKLGPRQVRYIRKLFKDPINPGGQWGLLYLMPGGNAIYDPVAAQQATDAPADDLVGSSGDSTPGKTASVKTTGGITPINMDPMGTGVQQGAGFGQTMLPGQGGAPGTVLRGAGMRGMMPGGMGGGMGGGLAGGLRGGAAGAFAAGGMSAYGASGGWGGGALPLPKPKSSSFDDDSASEPPIGWPIVGVISRASGDIAERTFKVYKGHEKVNEWQFHIFDTNINQGQTPMGTVPGGSAPPFIGPGFGGKGAIGGFGGGAGMNRGMWPGGSGQYPGGGQPGGGGRRPGQGGGRNWEPPPPPGGSRNN